MKYLIQDKQCSVRDSNRASLECDSGVAAVLTCPVALLVDLRVGVCPCVRVSVWCVYLQRAQAGPKQSHFFKCSVGSVLVFPEHLIAVYTWHRDAIMTS
jgi:hypothetical protein